MGPMELQEGIPSLKLSRTLITASNLNLTGILKDRVSYSVSPFYCYQRWILWWPIRAIITILYFHYKGLSTSNIGNFDPLERISDPINPSSSLIKGSLIVRTLEPLQNGQEPSYWGITFPSRIELLFSNPHDVSLSTSESNEESIKSPVDEEG